jgi:tetratricopeptide (TPR) repeat protein
MIARIFLPLSVLLIPGMMSAQADSWFKKGMDEKKPEKKVEYFTKSLETEGPSAETYLHRGDAYRDLALDRVYNHRGVVITFGHSETHNAQLMYDKARADYTKAIALNPGCYDAYIHRSDVYWQQGMNDRALADLTGLIKIDPRNTQAYFKRGFIYSNNFREYEKSISDLSMAIETDPDYKDAYYSRAFVYFRSKKYYEALADLDKLIGMDPEYVWAYCKRGDVFRVFGQYEKAIADYDKTIKLDPGNFIAYNDRGCIYLILSEYEKALHDFNKSISSNPKNMQPYCNIGYIYLQQNKFDNAIRYLKKSLDLVENFSDANLDLAIVYYKMGNNAEAKTCLDKARAGYPDLSEGFDGISKLECGGHDWTGRDLAILKEMVREMKSEE